MDDEDFKKLWYAATAWQRVLDANSTEKELEVINEFVDISHELAEKSGLLTGPSRPPICTCCELNDCKK
jgi:hypothetical protein